MSMIMSIFNIMMMSSNGNIFRVTGPLCGEFTGPGEFPTQRPVTRSFDVFFDLRPNKRLSKQWRGWWFETLSRPFWRHRNDSVTALNVILPGHRGDITMMSYVQRFACVYQRYIKAGDLQSLHTKGRWCGKCLPLMKRNIRNQMGKP